VLENTAVSNKFVYHYSTTENLSDDRHDETLPKPTTLRFPEDRSFVRFPDEAPMRQASQAKSNVVWPRDNSHQSGGLMRFWQEQPLINDFKYVSRGNSRGPNGGLSRVLSYRRNFR
jgi:hypothetical protein